LPAKLRLPIDQRGKRAVSKKAAHAANHAVSRSRRALDPETREGIEHPDPDADLMLRLKGGEDDVLNELMIRWQQPLVAFIYRYIAHETDALDLAQETFVRVYETRYRYTVRAKFSTWLFAIAANLCRNHFRRHRRREKRIAESWDIQDAELSKSLLSFDDSPDQALIKSESISALKEAISKLPHDLKSAILLYEYGGLSYEEISSLLRCSVKVIEMRLYRARASIRRRLLRTDPR
jgi:RNA polymerase sigma-70 factor (ECF subfamily)